MVGVIVKNIVKKENQKEFIRLSKEHIMASYEYDEGAVIFEMSEPIGEEIIFMEIWESEDFLNIHSENSNNREHLSLMKELTHDKEIKIFELASK